LIENHAYFPHRANVEFVQRLSDQTFRMRVWERGAGITMACGSGACAAAVAGARLGLVKGEVEIKLDGGSLWIEILADYNDVLPKESSGKNRVIMTGPVSYSFSGQITDLLSEAGKGMTQ
jgi:diaminopimelate epimerase